MIIYGTGPSQDSTTTVNAVTTEQSTAFAKDNSTTETTMLKKSTLNELITAIVPVLFIIICSLVLVLPIYKFYTKSKLETQRSLCEPDQKAALIQEQRSQNKRRD